MPMAASLTKARQLAASCRSGWRHADIADLVEEPAGEVIE
jgi:hypothetical protein